MHTHSLIHSFIDACCVPMCAFHVPINGWCAHAKYAACIPCHYLDLVPEQICCSVCSKEEWGQNMQISGKHFQTMRAIMASSESVYCLPMAYSIRCVANYEMEGFSRSMNAKLMDGLMRLEEVKESADGLTIGIVAPKRMNFNPQVWNEMLGVRA